MNTNPPLANTDSGLDREQRVSAPGLLSRSGDPATSGAGNGFPVAARTSRRPLTDREKQILRLVCDGLTNAEIAVRLGIAADTVKSEMKRIFRKIEVKNRTQAAMHLVRLGLV